MKIQNALLALVFIVATGLAHASTPEELIRPVQDQWAEIKYRQPAKQQAESYAKLAAQARKIVESNPRSAEALIWEGIVLSSEAGAQGGLGALGLAKQARQRLEDALALNDKALNGSVYTSLATLYAKVPSWPIGFGSDKKAEEYFRKSLAINPAGIDPNFFYAEYLADHDRISEARTHLEAALRAPARPGRELADSGRRQEIQALLAKINKESR
jgi:tetratricopeptide (TPR) repeat protein